MGRAWGGWQRRRSELWAALTLPTGWLLIEAVLQENCMNHFETVMETSLLVPSPLLLTCSECSGKIGGWFLSQPHALPYPQTTNSSFLSIPTGQNSLYVWVWIFPKAWRKIFGLKKCDQRPKCKFCGEDKSWAKTQFKMEPATATVSEPTPFPNRKAYAAPCPLWVAWLWKRKITLGSHSSGLSQWKAEFQIWTMTVQLILYSWSAWPPWIH